MSVLPDGLYDLFDERPRDALELQDTVTPGCGETHRCRATPPPLRKCSPGYPELLEEAADADTDGAREQRELELINGLTADCAVVAHRVATGPPGAGAALNYRGIRLTSAAASSRAGALAIHRRAR